MEAWTQVVAMELTGMNGHEPNDPEKKKEKKEVKIQPQSPYVKLQIIFITIFNISS